MEMLVDVTTADGRRKLMELRARHVRAWHPGNCPCVDCTSWRTHWDTCFPQALRIIEGLVAYLDEQWEDGWLSVASPGVCNKPPDWIKLALEQAEQQTKGEA
jgi:hypothetical protein